MFANNQTRINSNSDYWPVDAVAFRRPMLSEGILEIQFGRSNPSEEGSDNR
jgi:hypothetical protein